MAAAGQVKERTDPDGVAAPVLFTFIATVPLGRTSAGPRVPYLDDDHVIPPWEPGILAAAVSGAMAATSDPDAVAFRP